MLQNGNLAFEYRRASSILSEISEKSKQILCRPLIIPARHGSDAHVKIARSNTATFKTLDGITKGGARLYEEVMQVSNSIFVRHGGLHMLSSKNRLVMVLCNPIASKESPTSVRASPL